LLKEANRLSWLGNWYAAGPVYQRAEEGFHVANDRENEAYARVGRIRSEAPTRPLDETLTALTREIVAIEAMHNARLRMWSLALRGGIAIDSDSKAAERDWTETLQLADRLGEKQWAARASGELGILAFLKGNTAQAVSLVGKGILSAYASGDVAAQIRLVSILGLGFNEEKRYSEALTMFRRAISTAKSIPDAGFPFLAYRGEAVALAGLHEPDSAKRLLAEALAVARSQRAAVQEADLLIEEGKLAKAEGKLQESEAYFTNAKRIAEPLRLYRTIAEEMFDLADVQRQLGETDAAVQSLTLGLSASRHLGDRYYLPRDLAALAELKVAQNKFGDADSLFEEAEDVLDTIMANQHSFEESTARAGSMSPVYLGHFRLAQKTGKIDRAFQAIERVRGRTVASRLFVKERSGTKSPRITALESEIAATQLGLLGATNPEARSSLMEQLLEKERHLAFELNEAGLNRLDILEKPAPLKIVQEVLDDDELLAEYVLDEPKAFCIVITKRTSVLLTLPAGTGAIRTLANSYLSELKSRKSGDPYGSELYRVLIAPIISSRPQSRLIISPDGVLHALPFEALHNDEGFLARSKVVSYTPSGTVLWRLRQQRFQESARPLLAVGAVDYKLMRTIPKSLSDNQIATTLVRGLAALSGARLEDLPASRDEVLAIGRIAGPESRLLTGEEATETAFKSQPLSDFRVIHLATHAAADEQYPDRAALVLGVAPNTGDDGLLQVREIMGLPLNADLVTLSACDTNIGADRREAGVVSLEEGFLIAGARAVVASLWNIEDNSTKTLMQAFYGHLAHHEDKALALAHAKRDIMDRYGNLSPYYWAAFVIVGESREGVSFGR
jgi:CHAT domain-containing protein